MQGQRGGNEVEPLLDVGVGAVPLMHCMPSKHSSAYPTSGPGSGNVNDLGYVVQAQHACFHEKWA